MTEVFFIFIHAIFIIIISSLPFRFISFIKNKNLLLPASVTILSILLLVFSFFNLNLIHIKYFLWLIFFLNLFFLIKERDYLKFFSPSFLIFFLVFICFSFNISVDLNLGWDAQNYWIIKTLNFVNGNGIKDLQHLPRPDYPHFGSYLWAVFSVTSFLEHEYFGRMFYVYIFILSIFTISNYLNLREIFKIIIFLSILIIVNNSYIFRGYQEVLVFSYAVFLGCFIFEFQKNYKIKEMLLLLSLFFVILWIKNEAFIFALMLFVSFITFMPKKQFLLYTVFFVILIFLRILLYKLFQFDLNFQSGNYEKISFNSLDYFISFERLFIIIKFSIISMIKSPLVFIVFIVTYLNFYINKNFISKVVFLNLNLNILFIFFAYLLTSFPLSFHLSTSIDRLIFQALGFNIIVLVIFINKLSTKSPKDFY